MRSQQAACEGSLKFQRRGSGGSWAGTEVVSAVPLVSVVEWCIIRFD